MNHIHFIGIGGTGMSGLAKMCLEKGIHVTGSDLKNSATVQTLRDLGADIRIGHGFLPEKVSLVVYSTAVPEDNPELQAARSRGILLWHRRDMLRYLAEGKTVFGVAGAHGKTTTTTMLAEIFVKARRNPSIAAGGKLLFEGANGRYDKRGDVFIAELDESDGSFLQLEIDSAIITNIDDDHLDFYGSKENLDKAFGEFIKNVNGTLAVNGMDEKVMELAQGQGRLIDRKSVV